MRIKDKARTVNMLVDTGTCKFEALRCTLFASAAQDERGRLVALRVGQTMSVTVPAGARPMSITRLRDLPFVGC
jgi:hypothetical protein